MVSEQGEVALVKFACPGIEDFILRHARSDSSSSLPRMNRLAEHHER
jgi:hypothetical protein